MKKVVEVINDVVKLMKNYRILENDFIQKSGLT